MQYSYPENLKSKPMMFLWELKDVGIIGVLALFSVFAIAQTGIVAPLIITVVYGFLAINYEGVSILGFIKSAINFFIFKPQFYEWQA
ncbi:MAG: hypothetical protein R3Y09_13915 [Clostridia bacterium]